MLCYKNDCLNDIDTGSVALSPYEILQAVWNDYLLDKEILKETFHAYDMALTLINQEYEICAVREAGSFDIFKNLVGLNHMICCKENCHILFKSNTFKKLPGPIVLPDGKKNYYNNAGITFEIYSTLLCGAPNKIAKAVEDLFQSGYSQKEISRFTSGLNHVIYEAVDIAVDEISKRGSGLQDSKYHSIYILAGIIFSQYDIVLEQGLSVRKTKTDESVLQKCLDLDMHKANKWFVDENRQVDFFNIKVKELLDQKEGQDRQERARNGGKEGLLEIDLCGKTVQAYTVKEFYREIFTYLLAQGIDLETSIPFATGRKRYLVNTENRHINGNPFVSPIKVERYYIETHKSRSCAMRDIVRFLEAIGIMAH